MYLRRRAARIRIGRVLLVIEAKWLAVAVLSDLKEEISIGFEKTTKGNQTCQRKEN